VTSRRNPPFRAEHIGSLLRPEEVKKAFSDRALGKISDGALSAIEDRHIQDVVRLQERVGLHSITDGEYRRTIYWGHFPKAVSGFTEMEAEIEFQDGSGRTMKYTTAVVNGRLERRRGIAVDEFLHVKSLTRETPKTTLPSPASQHYFRFREGVSEKAYPDLDEFYADVARVYREELAELAARGATYVQLDDVSLPLLCDGRLREQVRRRGYDPDELVDRYIALTNESIEERAPALTVGMHLCRGNNQGKWLGEGGYEPVAEKIFGGIDVDFFCLEYDSPRAGSFEPLRFLPEDKIAILGLVSTKTAALEPPEELKRRIEEACRYVPLERLGLSPQCGFASTAPGNPLTAEDQRRKLELVVNVARSLWSDA
jgi:5-methyltetrahydropteroyltriglutamate--homocysteine methyltransferase